MNNFRYGIIFLIMIGLSIPALSAYNPRVVLETNFGDILIELYPDDAPITVDNFLNYVDDGFYNSLVFHRVIENFMIQSGAYYTKGYTIYYKSPTYGSIINESDNGLSNLRGTIAMARTSDPDSASSQFFINHVDNLFLDRENASDGYGYCVFGQVIDGMDVVDAIALVDTAYVNSSLADFPYNPPVFIHTAYQSPCVLSYCSDLASAGEINFEDFAMFALHWLDDICEASNGFCDGADLDYSSGVDSIDLNIFWDHWTQAAGYESQFSDLIPDYVVDSVDFSLLSARWLYTDCQQDNNYCDGADINRDGSVDLTDYALLMNNWLTILPQ